MTIEPIVYEVGNVGLLQADSVRPEIDNIILHMFFGSKQNLGSYFKSRYVVTLQVNLLTNIWLNLSKK